VWKVDRLGRNLRHLVNYREGQEDQLGTLGLVVNVIVLWNTIYMDAVLQQLRREGYPVREEDVARLSPLIYEHTSISWGAIRSLYRMPSSGESCDAYETQRRKILNRVHGSVAP
jgi:Tn3 transposase DDE domain